MSSNLPPGCSSPDGGIDHALEAALDTLCNAIETPEEAARLLELLPVVRKIDNEAYHVGLEEGRAEERQRAEAAYERAVEEMAR